MAEHRRFNILSFLITLLWVKTEPIWLATRWVLFGDRSPLDDLLRLYDEAPAIILTRDQAFRAFELRAGEHAMFSGDHFRSGPY